MVVKYVYIIKINYNNTKKPNSLKKIPPKNTLLEINSVEFQHLMSFPLEVIYNLKCAYRAMIDMDRIINMMNIIMQKS
jgi:hypothetical protein